MKSKTVIVTSIVAVSTLVAVSIITFRCRDEFAPYIEGDSLADVFLDAATIAKATKARPGEVLVCLMRSILYSKATLLDLGGSTCPLESGFQATKGRPRDRWLIEDPRGHLFDVEEGKVYGIKDGSLIAVERGMNLDTNIVGFSRFLIIYRMPENTLYLLE